MKRIGDELQAATKALSLPMAQANILDICMAPRGYSASVLKHSPHACISALTLPKNLGGFPVMTDYGHKDTRINVIFADVTMFAAEFCITDIPKDHPDFGRLISWRPFPAELFDLVLCDGQVLRTQTPHIEECREGGRATRLTCSQLTLGMQRIKPGGTFILLLHKPEMWNTIKLLSLFDKISEIQLLKPTVAHRTRSSFYLIATNVQSRHPEALRAVAEWRSTWKSFTFPQPMDEKEVNQQQAEQMHMECKEAMDLLTSFGHRLLELGGPIWLIQRDALKKAPWLKNREPGPSGHADGPPHYRASDDSAENPSASSM